jgi:hypothetical protein
MSIILKINTFGWSNLVTQVHFMSLFVHFLHRIDIKTNQSQDGGRSICVVSLFDHFEACTNLFPRSDFNNETIFGCNPPLLVSPQSENTFGDILMALSRLN